MRTNVRRNSCIGKTFTPPVRENAECYQHRGVTLQTRIPNDARAVQRMRDALATIPPELAAQLGEIYYDNKHDVYRLQTDSEHIAVQFQCAMYEQQGYFAMMVYGSVQGEEKPLR